MKHTHHFLRTIRMVLATFFFVAVTLLFLGLGTQFNLWLSWVAQVQFLPALMALDFAILIGLILLTLLFGRLYCSVICPLGVMQDLFGWMGKKRKKNRYSYSSEKKWLRYIRYLPCFGFCPCNHVTCSLLCLWTYRSFSFPPPIRLAQ